MYFINKMCIVNIVQAATRVLFRHGVLVFIEVVIFLISNTINVRFCLLKWCLLISRNVWNFDRLQLPLPMEYFIGLQLNRDFKEPVAHFKCRNKWWLLFVCCVRSFADGHRSWWNNNHHGLTIYKQTMVDCFNRFTINHFFVFFFFEFGIEIGFVYTRYTIQLCSTINAVFERNSMWNSNEI